MSEKKISVLIIYTGGTIGMIQDPETGALMPFNFDHLLDNVPELKRLGFLISSMSFCTELIQWHIRLRHLVLCLRIWQNQLF